MLQPIKLIASDIDGTLLTSRHEIAPRTQKAVRQAMERGIQFVLATGKTHRSAQGIIRQLGLTSPGVFVQGLVICAPDGSVLHSRALSSEAVQHTLLFVEKHDAPVVAYSGSRLIAPAINQLTQILMDHGEPQPEWTGTVSRMAGIETVNKLILHCESAQMPAFREKLIRHVDGGAEVVQPLPYLIEIVPVGASKWAGLKWLLNDLGILPKSVLAIGDGENDALMLRHAGIGIAVANAMPQAWAAADHVVASNDNDGVAEAIEHFAP